MIAQKWCYGHVNRALLDDSSHLILAILTNGRNKMSDLIVVLSLGFNQNSLPEFNNGMVFIKIDLHPNGNKKVRYRGGHLT